VDEATQATSSSVGLPPWGERLLYALLDCVVLLEYFNDRIAGSGGEIPTVPELAVDLIGAAIQMLLWRYPDGVVRNLVNAIRAVPAELEAAIEEDLNTLIQEVL